MVLVLCERNDQPAHLIQRTGRDALFSRINLRGTLAEGAGHMRARW
jgi:hypothetical protein